MIMTEEAYNKGLRCRGICSLCREGVNSCYQFIKDVKGTRFDGDYSKESDSELEIKEVNCYDAIQALFKDNKKVLVRHHCDGIDIDEIWESGLNISMQCGIKVSVLYKGKFYILD